MKAVLQYVVLVGIPVLIVVGLLQIGEHFLRAPASVGGAWELELMPQSVNDLSCGDLPFQADQPVLTISQSGPQLRLSFNDEHHTTLAGQLKDLTITAEVVAPSRPAESPLALRATVDRQTEPNRFQGTLTAAPCGTTLSLTATRRPESDQLTGNH